LKRAEWYLDERKGQKPWIPVIQYPLMLDDENTYRVRIISGKHRDKPGKTQKRQKRMLAVPNPKIEKPLREPLKIERPTPPEAKPREKKDREEKCDPWNPKFFWEDQQQEKERENERLKREKRQIQIAYQGETWNISIDGTTTEEDIRQSAEGMSRTPGLALREDRTHREEGKYAFERQTDEKEIAEAAKREREREEKQRWERKQRRGREREYAPQKPQPPSPGDRPVWGSAPRPIEPPPMASKLVWGCDSSTPIPRDDLSNRAIVRQIHWRVNGKEKFFEKKAPEIQIALRGGGNRRELLVVQSEARSIDTCGVFEKIENLESGRALRQKWVMSTSVLAESRGSPKGRSLLEESDVMMHEWNRREAARTAFASEFEERGTTFERRPINQPEKGSEERGRLSGSEISLYEKGERPLILTRSVMRCSRIRVQREMVSSGTQSERIERKEQRAIEWNGVVEIPERSESFTRRTLVNSGVQTMAQTTTADPTAQVMKAVPKTQVTKVETSRTQPTKEDPVTPVTKTWVIPISTAQPKGDSRPRFETRVPPVTQATKVELVTTKVQAKEENEGNSDEGATRMIQEELHVRFEGWTYCLERNRRWRVEREGWMVREFDEKSEVRLEGSRLRIIFRGTSYWLREDGHWGLGPLE
jgi:hypothetical protein